MEGNRGFQRSSTLEPDLAAEVHRFPLSASDIPASIVQSLKRLRMFPDAALMALNQAIYGFESVARVGDVAVVADPEVLSTMLVSRNAVNPCVGIQYRISKVIVLPDRASDLVIERSQGDSSSCDKFRILTPGDTQAMGIGYVPRTPTELLTSLSDRARAALPVFDNASTLSSYYSQSVDLSVAPTRLYVSSRKPAVVAGAGWADITENVQWLPVDLVEFEKRV
jgi:hypothetical protein